MKTNLLFFILLGGILLAPTFVDAQKIKKESVKISYLQLPLNPLSKEFKNYSAVINSKLDFPKRQSLSINNRSISTQAKAEQDYLSLEGLERVSSNADVNVVLNIGNIKIIASSIGSGTDPYSKKKIFYADITYNLPASLKVTDKDSNAIIDEVISAPEQTNAIRVGSDGSFGNTGSSYFSQKDLKESVENRLASEALLDILVKSSNHIAELAPKTMTRKYMFYSAENKKYDYTDLMQAQQYALQALTMINSKSDAAQIKETFQKAIIIWDKAIAEADVNNDKARINEKIYKMLHFNCALASMLSDDFQSAKKYAEIAKDYNPPVPLVRTGSDDEDYKEPILEQIRDREARQRANRS